MSEETINILFIEDDIEEVVLLRRALEDSSESEFNLSHVESLKEGFEKIKKSRPV